VEINYLKQAYIASYLLDVSSFVIKFSQSGDVWLFNCIEGCQHILLIKKIKISQIKKIIITDNSINNISGILGLLSSISLNTRTQRIDILGPVGLKYYLFGGRKYSQTNFRYKLYLYELSKKSIFNQFYFNLSVLYNTNTDNLKRDVILSSESSGSLDSVKALNYSIPFGPYYGYLKLGKKFILPDGFIFCNQDFVSGYLLGYKFII
jgi:ribonuclease Z